MLEENSQTQLIIYLTGLTFFFFFFYFLFFSFWFYNSIKSWYFPLPSFLLCYLVHNLLGMIGGDMFAIKLGHSPPNATARFIIHFVTRIRSLIMIFAPPRITKDWLFVCGSTTMKGRTNLRMTLRTTSSRKSNISFSTLFAPFASQRLTNLFLIAPSIALITLV